MIIALIIAFSYGVQALKFIKTKLFSKSTLDDGSDLIEFECTDVQFEVAVDGSTYFETDGSFKFAPPVYVQRYVAVVNELENHGIFKKVLELGCSELSFFQYIKELGGVEEAVFVDIDEELIKTNSAKTEPLASDFLRKRCNPFSVEILSGNAAIPDKSFFKADAVVAIELIEHMLPEDLDRLPHCIFGIVQPYLVVFTTPNSDFNVLFTSLDGFRHPDHKFEWSRRQFKDWGLNIVNRYPEYNVYFRGIGPGPEGSEKLGCCSQMAVFERNCPSTTDESLFKDIFKVIRKVVYPFEVEIEVSIENQIGYECDKFIRYAEQVDDYYTPDGIFIPISDLLRMVSKISESKELLKEVLKNRKISVKTLESGTEVAVIPLEGLSCDDSESTCESDFSNSCPPKAESICDGLYEVMSDWDAGENSDGSTGNIKFSISSNKTCLELDTLEASNIDAGDSVCSNFDKDCISFDSNISKDQSLLETVNLQSSDENLDKSVKKNYKCLGQINSGPLSVYTDGDVFSPFNKDINYPVCDNLYSTKVANNFSICSSIPLVSESVIQQDINVYCVLGNGRKESDKDSGSESSLDEHLNKLRDFPVTEQVSASKVKPSRPCDNDTQSFQKSIETCPTAESSLKIESSSLFSKSNVEKSNTSCIHHGDNSISLKECLDSQMVQLDSVHPSDFNHHNSKLQSNQWCNNSVLSTLTLVESNDISSPENKFCNLKVENECCHDECSLSDNVYLVKEEKSDPAGDVTSFMSHVPPLSLIGSQQSNKTGTEIINSSEIIFVKENKIQNECQSESRSTIKEKLIKNFSEPVTNFSDNLTVIKNESGHLNNEMSFPVREAVPIVLSDNSMDALNKSFLDYDSANSSNGTLCEDTSINAFSSDDSAIAIKGDANSSGETLVEYSIVEEISHNCSDNQFNENINSSLQTETQETIKDVSLNFYLSSIESSSVETSEESLMPVTVGENNSQSICNEIDSSVEMFSADSLSIKNVQLGNSSSPVNKNIVTPDQKLVKDSLIVSAVPFDFSRLSDKLDVSPHSIVESFIENCSKTDVNNSAFFDEEKSYIQNSVQNSNVNLTVSSEIKNDKINSITNNGSEESTTETKVSCNESVKEHVPFIQGEQSLVSERSLNLCGKEIVKTLLEDLISGCVEIAVNGSVIPEDKTAILPCCFKENPAVGKKVSNNCELKTFVAQEVSLSDATVSEQKTDINSTSMNPTTIGLSRCQSLQLIKENGDKKMNRFSLSCEKDSSMGSNYSDFGEYASDCASIFENCQVESAINMDDSYSLSKAVDSGYPNTSDRDMDTDMTPEQVDEISENDSSFEEREEDDNQLMDVPVQGGPAPVHFLDNVENGDVANNNRDDEGNNMDGIDVGEVINFEQLIINRDEDLQLNDPPQHHESDSEDEYKYLSACESLTDETIIQEDESEQTLGEFDSLYSNSCGWWESTPARPSRQWHFVRFQQESNVPLEMSSTSLIAHTSSGTLNSESSSRNAIQFGGLENRTNDSFPYWLLNMLSEENATDMAQGDANSAQDLIDVLRNESEPSMNGVDEWAIEEIIPGDMMGGGEPNTHI